MASNNVLITLCIEASRKSLELMRSTSSIPLGSDSRIFSTSLSIASMISLAFEPEVCEIMHVVPGFPLTEPRYSYVFEPSSTFATSLSRNIEPSGCALITRFSKSRSFSYRPRYFKRVSECVFGFSPECSCG